MEAKNFHTRKEVKVNKNNFQKLTKEERANIYGGFFWGALTAIAALTSTLVSAGIAVYQAVTHRGGSVSFGGSKTITQKEAPVAPHTSATPKTQPPKINSSSNINSFTVY